MLHKNKAKTQCSILSAQIFILIVVQGSAQGCLAAEWDTSDRTVSQSTSIRAMLCRHWMLGASGILTRPLVFASCPVSEREVLFSQVFKSTFSRARLSVFVIYLPSKLQEQELGHKGHPILGGGLPAPFRLQNILPLGMQSTMM